MRATELRRTAASTVLAILAICGVGRAAGDDFQREVLSDRPFVFYRFNETFPASSAADESGNLLHAAYSASGTTLEQTATAGDRAVGFSGGWAVVQNDPLLNPERISIEAVIVWRGNTGAQQRICEKSTESAGVRAVYNLCISPEGTPLFEVDVGLGAPLGLSSCVKIPENQASHLVATVDGSTLSLYVDGVLATSVPQVGTSLLRSSNRPLTIGNQIERDRAFNGLIDELVLYDHALPAERILAHARTIPELLQVGVDCDPEGGSGAGGDAGGKGGSPGAGGDSGIPDGSGGTTSAGGSSGDGGSGASSAGNGPSGSGGVPGNAGGGAMPGGTTGAMAGVAGSNPLRSKPTVDIDGSCACAVRSRDQRFLALIGAAALAVLVTRRRRAR